MAAVTYLLNLGKQMLASFETEFQNEAYRGHLCMTIHEHNKINEMQRTAPSMFNMGLQEGTLNTRVIRVAIDTHIELLALAKAPLLKEWQ